MSPISLNKMILKDIATLFCGLQLVWRFCQYHQVSLGLRGMQQPGWLVTTAPAESSRMVVFVIFSLQGQELKLRNSK